MSQQAELQQLQFTLRVQVPINHILTQNPTIITITQNPSTQLLGGKRFHVPSYDFAKTVVCVRSEVSAPRAHQRWIKNAMPQTARFY